MERGDVMKPTHPAVAFRLGKMSYDTSPNTASSVAFRESMKDRIRSLGESVAVANPGVFHS